jgi:hypothetical protein
MTKYKGIDSITLPVYVYGGEPVLSPPTLNFPYDNYYIDDCVGSNKYEIDFKWDESKDTNSIYQLLITRDKESYDTVYL